MTASSSTSVTPPLVVGVDENDTLSSPSVIIYCLNTKSHRLQPVVLMTLIDKTRGEAGIHCAKASLTPPPECAALA